MHKAIQIKQGNMILLETKDKFKNAPKTKRY